MSHSTILFLAANPAHMHQLQLGEECRMIEDRIRGARFRDHIRFRSRWATRPDDLLQALNEDNPSVLHFSGHGTSAQGLCLQAQDGGVLNVGAEDLARVMQAAGSSVNVVLLNACYTEMQAQALAIYIPCVIGISRTIDDDNAIVYAASFYRALAFGKSVANAHKQGIAAISLSAGNRPARDIEYSQTASNRSAPRLMTRPDTDANNVYIISEPSDTTRCTIIIKATLREFNAEMITRVTRELRQWTGDLSLQIVDIEEGSVRLTISLSREAAQKLDDLTMNGQLTHLCGFDVHAMESGVVSAKILTATGRAHRIHASPDLVHPGISANRAVPRSHPLSARAPAAIGLWILFVIGAVLGLVIGVVWIPVRRWRATCIAPDRRQSANPMSGGCRGVYPRGLRTGIRATLNLMSSVARRRSIKRR